VSSAGVGLVVPTFDIPFASAISPFSQSIVEHIDGWLREFSVLPHDRLISELRQDRITLAGAHLAPNASLTQACLIGDWTTFLIVLDDEFDERELGRDPARAEAAIDLVLRAFSDGSVSRDSGLAGLTRAACDLGRRFALISSPPGWLSRFSTHLKEHILSKSTEAQHRAAGEVLSVDAYIELRRITGAPFTYSDLIELSEQVVIAERVRESLPWASLLETFADVWLGIQDICSCAKEVAIGDTLNLAVAIQHADKCTLQEAVYRANSWVTARARGMQTAKADLVALVAESNSGVGSIGELGRYIEALELLLGGHLIWNSEGNPRYETLLLPR
jgi:hypothetical protein